MTARPFLLFLRRPPHRPDQTVVARTDPRSARRLCRLILSRIAREFPRRPLLWP